MADVNCPHCGEIIDTTVRVCPRCGSNGKVTEEMLAWARAQPFDLEEFLAGVREIEQSGGLKLEDFIHEVEQEVKRREQ